MDQIEPLTAEQLQMLLGAARAGRNPQRDVALLLVVVDTGLRASELCSLIVADADRDGPALPRTPGSLQHHESLTGGSEASIEYPAVRTPGGAPILHFRPRRPLESDEEWKWHAAEPCASEPRGVEWLVPPQ